MVWGTGCNQSPGNVLHCASCCLAPHPAQPPSKMRPVKNQWYLHSTVSYSCPIVIFLVMCDHHIKASILDAPGDVVVVHVRLGSYCFLQELYKACIPHNHVAADAKNTALKIQQGMRIALRVEMMLSPKPFRGKALFVA